jgi:O-antigen/teichoic acid export membrane protein
MIKNIIANFIGRFWGILSGFLFIPLYIHYLGFESYSIISFGLVIAGLMAILDAGLTATLSREFARTDNSYEEKLRIFKTLESSYFILVIICIVVVFSLSHFLAYKWLNLDSHDPGSVSLFLKIISFDIGFQLLLRFYTGGLLGLEKQVKANFYQVGWGMLKNGLVLLPIIFYPRLDVFFTWQAISTIIFTVLLKLSLEKNLNGILKFEFKPIIERVVFKRIWKFAGGMLLISLIAGLNSQMDKIAISKLLALESLGYYTLAVSLASVIVVLVNPISIAILPRFTALFTAGKNTEAAVLFRKISLAVSIMVFSGMANMVFFGKELIWIWTGKMELAERASEILPILVISYSMLAIAMMPYGIAIANGYTKLNNLLGIVSLFVTMPGYWLATKYFGAVGAASVFCGVQTLITLVYLYFINKKFLKAKLITIYLKELILPMLISLIIVYGISLIPKFYTNSQIISLAVIGISTLITFTVTTLILISWQDVKFYINIKSQLIKTIKK